MNDKLPLITAVECQRQVKYLLRVRSGQHQGNRIKKRLYNLSVSALRESLNVAYAL
jgi:hypothetical protein